MATEGFGSSGTRRVADSSLARTAGKMVAQIEALVADIIALRRENDALRAEVHHAVAMLERASAALGDHRVNGRGDDGVLRRRASGRPKGPKGRATPAAVTADVVRAVVAKLGSATASEIASEITLAGVPVSGRAVRFIAERAGATTSVGEDGQRRYRFE